MLFCDMRTWSLKDTSTYLPSSRCRARSTNHPPRPCRTDGSSALLVAIAAQPAGLVDPKLDAARPWTGQQNFSRLISGAVLVCHVTCVSVLEDLAEDIRKLVRNGHCNCEVFTSLTWGTGPCWSQANHFTLTPSGGALQMSLPCTYMRQATCLKAS